MQLSIEQVLQQGVAAHKEGNFKEAERLYRAVLQPSPQHPDANHNLGVLAVTFGKIDIGLSHFKIALESNPKIEQFWLSYIEALIKAKRIDDAKQIIQRAKNRGVDGEKLTSMTKQVDVLNGKENTSRRNPSNAQVISLQEHYENGRYDDAEKLAVNIVKEFPEYKLGWTVLAATFSKTGQKTKALFASQKAVELSPHSAPILNNLGVVLREMDKLDEASVYLKQAIAFKPDFAEGHYNLGMTFHGLGRLEEAKSSHRQAIVMKPNFAEGHYNLGITFQGLGRLEEAKSSHRQAIVMKPNFADSHNSLGATLKDLGRLKEAEAIVRRALMLAPDHIKAHGNLYATLQERSKLEEAEETLRRMLELMLVHKSESISSAKKPPVIALIPFGRSGSLFFHSLIDGHPEIATLPGVYFNGWFGLDQWQKLAPDYSQSNWRECLVIKVAREFEPLFDASCRNNVTGKPLANTPWLARDLGFTNMGPDRSQSFLLDKDAFCREFLILLRSLSALGISECFELIHRAFEVSVRNNNDAKSSDNRIIFYHLHNPNAYDHLHFSKHYPEARFLHLIRNPLQSMESWMLASSREPINDSSNQKKKHVLLIESWRKMVANIIFMFRQILSPPINTSLNYGVRLEDIKRNPDEFMPKIAAWIGVKDHLALYQSAFCGLQYWGPSSITGNITGFDTRAIDMSVGRILGARDIVIFETLFWPLSKRYSYTQMNATGFYLRLAEIRPWLDEPLEFEKQIFEQMADHGSPIEGLDPYIRLHQFMHLLWNTLDRDKTYVGIPKPME